MQTSQQWWNSVKVNPSKFKTWLLKQYCGEVTAASRIREIQGGNEKETKILEIIADQETQHAIWIKSLLASRNCAVPDDSQNAENRYWAIAKQAMRSFQTSAAIAAHAEHMRLERIRVIVKDPEIPSDVREVFEKILLQEIFHEKAFAAMAGKKALQETKVTQQLAQEALGLVA